MKTVGTKVIVCLVGFAVASYSYLSEQNRCIVLSMQLPKITQEVDRILEKNEELRFEIERFGDPVNLLHYQTSFACVFPSVQEIASVHEGVALQRIDSGSGRKETFSKMGSAVLLGCK